MLTYSFTKNTPRRKICFFGQKWNPFLNAPKPSRTNCAVYGHYMNCLILSDLGQKDDHKNLRFGIDFQTKTQCFIFHSHVACELRSMSYGLLQNCSIFQLNVPFRAHHTNTIQTPLQMPSATDNKTYGISQFLGLRQKSQKK